MRLLFVCTGNICRSPTAEAVARQVAAARGLDWQVDSAGTSGFHAGEAPDGRSVRCARTRGYELSGLRAREVTVEDFRTFDHVIALDQGHYRHLKRMQPAGAGAELSLLTDWMEDPAQRDVPDPYFGPAGGFDRVLDLIEAAIGGLADRLGGRD